jgi:cytochrome P450
MSQSSEFDLASPTFKANPYPTFARLRAADPVHRIKMPNGGHAWLITRYHDADMVLRDERFVKNVRNVFPPEALVPMPVSGFTFLSRHMLNMDVPDHTRLRSLINLSFTPRLVERWRGRILEITNALLDAVQDQGEMDLIDQFAFPLPIIVISEMLGVPAEDRLQFRTWSNLVVESSGNPDRGNVSESLLAFSRYLRTLIEKKRQFPADDLLSQLISAEMQGDTLSEEELVSMLFLLIIAGHETTVNLISNGILALLEHPEQMDVLKQRPALIKTAIEEFLRYRGPLQVATQRWAREDIEFGGQLIHRGDAVMVVLSATNRDDEAFIDPDTLDITRQENRHLAFGKGIHYCLGAPLARLEGQIAIGELVRRLPNLRLNADPQELVWRPGSLIMGLSNLPVTF